MTNILRRLIRGRRKKRPERIRLIDTQGHPIIIDRDLLEEAAKADLLDLGATLNGDFLQWQGNTTFTLNIWGLRNIVELAMQHDNPDIALVNVAANLNWLHDLLEEDEDDEDL